MAWDLIVAGRVPIQPLEHLVDDRPSGKRLRLGIQPLRLELVVDEPPVRALDPLLDRSGADGVPLGERGEHVTCRQGARQNRIAPRPDRRERARERALARRIGRLEHHAVEPPHPLQPFLRLTRARSQEVEHVVDEGRSRRGAAVLVAASP
jgi:hypothetical protein